MKLPKKSDNISAKYMHRGAYINKIFYGNGWFVHFVESSIAGKIPKGLKAKTLAKLVVLIDEALN